jgi:hypothetical protein
VHSGKGVSVGAMYLAVRACGWTHKKKALLMFEWVRRCGARHDFPSVTVLGEASPERANRCA